MDVGSLTQLVFDLLLSADMPSEYARVNKTDANACDFVTITIVAYSFLIVTS